MIPPSELTTLQTLRFADEAFLQAHTVSQSLVILNAVLIIIIKYFGIFSHQFFTLFLFIHSRICSINPGIYYELKNFIRLNFLRYARERTFRDEKNRPDYNFFEGSGTFRPVLWVQAAKPRPPLYK